MTEYRTNEQPIPAEVPPEVQRSLLGTLASDANSVVTQVVGGAGATVAGAYVIKKMLGGKGGDGDSGSQDSPPPA